MIKFPQSEKAALQLGCHKLQELRAQIRPLHSDAMMRGNDIARDMYMEQLKQIDRWLLKAGGNQ